jgi:ATP-dependent DNA ligase
MLSTSTVLTPPIEPMLAKIAEELPTDDGFMFEPKWDGFRALVFRKAGEVVIQSRDLRPLDRYFPELAKALLEILPRGCVIDGEIVIATPGGLDFDALQQRLHPAASRVARLAQATPASFVAFDLLAAGGKSVMTLPQSERRSRLEQLLGSVPPPVYLTPMTRDRATALDWLSRFEGAGLDGVMAKLEDAPYQAGKRAMFKIKHSRTADCVVAGFRWYKETRDAVGSLLLGLYDDEGVLQHVGIASAFTLETRRQLADELEHLRKDAMAGHPWRNWANGQAEGGDDAASASGEAGMAPDETQQPRRMPGDSQAPRRMPGEARGARRMPGAGSRWSAGKDLSWEALRPERVCEVKYDHLQGERFRHATQFLRWREDKQPQDCRYDQLEITTPFELERVFGAGKK